MATSTSGTEYDALRATIRERGTRRIMLFWLTITFWSGAMVIGRQDWSNPLGTLITLVPLVAGFEAVFALHVGVERIGRYLQVFHEPEQGVPAWEHLSMVFQTPSARAGLDPLFITPFALVNLLNFAPVVLGSRLDYMLVGLAAHVAFAGRLIVARRFAAGQRAADLARFIELKAGR